MRLRYLWMIVLAIAMGCAPKKETEARTATLEHKWDQAYRLWSAMLAEDPTDTKYRLEVERARMNASLEHLRKAQRYFERGMLSEAAFEVNLVVGYDPDNQQALTLGSLIKEQQEAAKLEEDRNARIMEEEPVSNLPMLTPTTWAPLNLKFNNQSTRDIYTSIGKAYGINIVMDNSLRENKMTIDLRNLSFLKALDTLMILNRHFFKIVDDNTIIILKDDKQNRDRYDNQIIQTFYLSNITVKDLKNHLRQLGGLKNIAENEKLNTISIKGTPDQLALARKIIADNDKAQAEVIVEIELLEVNKNRMRKVGILPVNSSDFSPLFRAGIAADPVSRTDADEDAGGIRGIFPDLNSNDYLTVVPALAIDFLKEHGDSTQVANPHLRVTSGEEGLVRIGQSIPIAQTSFTNANLSGTAGGGNNSFGDNALTTFDYNDVGIIIKVNPRVHYNNEITLDLELGVTSVLSAGLQPILGKREVTTSIRLKNGETNVIAGLLTNEERKTLLGLPGLSDIPVLGKLFSNDEKVISQTDIIMTIRPVIVRGPSISRKDRAPYELNDLRLSSLYNQEKAAKAKEEAAKQIQTDPAFGDQSTSGGASDESDDGYRNAFDPNAPEPGDSEDEEESIYEDYEEDAEDAPPPAMLAFTPSGVEARQDEALEFQLFVTNVDGMRRGEIVINFDPKVLRAEGVDLGDFFATREQRPLMTPAWDNARGRLTMIFTQRHGSTPFSGSGILANIKFRAIQPGSGTITFDDIKLETLDKSTIPAEGLEGSYEVNP